MIYICKVSKVNYKKGTVDVTIPELEGIVKKDLFVSADAYDMPAVGDTVAVIFNREGANITRGFALGKVWNSSYLPQNPGEKNYIKNLPGDCQIRAESGNMTVESGGEIALKAGSDIKLNTSRAKLTIDSEIGFTVGSANLTAGSGKITLSVGRTSLIISSSGITATDGTDTKRII